MLVDNRKIYESPNFLLTEFEIGDIISTISNIESGTSIDDGVIPAW
jgi:hypothetical protein